MFLIDHLLIIARVLPMYKLAYRVDTRELRANSANFGRYAKKNNCSKKSRENHKECYKLHSGAFKSKRNTK